MALKRKATTQGATASAGAPVKAKAETTKLGATAADTATSGTVTSATLAAVTRPEEPTYDHTNAAASALDVAQTMEKTMKTAEDFLAFGQGNMDAFVKSSQIWAAGVQDLSKQFAATAQASFDEAMATFKAMSAVKSPKDALDMQATLVRANLEKAVAETGKITDASLKLAEQVFAPITAQMIAMNNKILRAGSSAWSRV